MIYQVPPCVNIGPYGVGPSRPPFIVGEVGINHNGDIGLALSMIKAAKLAGCDAVKFQTFRATEFVGDPSQMFTYQSQGKAVTESMLGMFKRFELPQAAWAIIKRECQKQDILFLSTPQNLSDLHILLDVGIPAIKVGSDDFTNLPLLKSFAQSGLPLILSSGMSDLAEAHHALEAVGAFEGYPVILLACTSQYPTPPDDVNLARISTLQSAFPMVPIGFSDHTRGSLASSLALALGATFFEKHFTLDHDLPGPDHWFSEDPEGLRDWVASIRMSTLMMGNPLVRPTKVERDNKQEYQRRIVAARAIASGELLTVDAVTMRRISGGKGLPPYLLPHLIGRPVSRAFYAGEPLEL